MGAGLLCHSIQDVWERFVNHAEGDSGIQILFGAEFSPGLPLYSAQDINKPNVANVQGDNLTVRAPGAPAEPQSAHREQSAKAEQQLFRFHLF